MEIKAAFIGKLLEGGLIPESTSSGVCRSVSATLFSPLALTGRSAL